MTCIEAIIFYDRLALTSDGRTIPITNWFDIDGDECEPWDAVSCVAKAGADSWCAVDLSQFGPVMTQ